MARNNNIDWQACERDYRTGTFSNRQLAELYNCAESAVRDRAKRFSWEKDLSEAVRKATNAKLLRADLRVKDATEDAQIIDGGADVRVAVVTRHRKNITRLESIKDALVSRAAALTEDVIDLKSLGDAASAVESLGRTLAKLILLDRQAFNLDEEKPQAGVQYVERDSLDRDASAGPTKG